MFKILIAAALAVQQGISPRELDYREVQRELVDSGAGLSLDVSGGSTAPNAVIVQNRDYGSTNQRWKIEQDNIVRLESKNIANTYIRHSNSRAQISPRDDFRTTPF